MENPYQTSAPSAYPASSGSVTPGVLQALAATKPWVRLCSIMGFIGAGFMILAGLLMMAGGAAATLNPSRGAAGLAGMPVIAGVFYILFAALYLIPSIKLWRYGTAILRLISSNSPADLENALEQQRGFWKFVGIMMLISIAVMVLAMIGGMIVGFASAMR
jgi:magnesium-transporting ATPase (P-type)